MKLAGPWIKWSDWGTVGVNLLSYMRVNLLHLMAINVFSLFVCRGVRVRAMKI